MKNKKFCTYSVLLFKTCTNTTLNFLLRRCLRDVNIVQYNFFPESELGCGPHDPVGKFTNICHFKREKRRARKFKKKTTTNKQRNILIARDVFVALAVQARMIKCGKVIIIIIIIMIIIIIIIIMMVY